MKKLQMWLIVLMGLMPKESVAGCCKSSCYSCYCDTNVTRCSYVEGDYPFDLHLPFMGGETWHVDQTFCGCCSHNGYHGIDFNGGENGAIGDNNLPVVASANGIVASTKDHNDLFGLSISVLYDGGNYGKTSHHSWMVVKPGQYVQSSQVLGFVGKYPSDAYHLHYQIQKTASGAVNTITYGFVEAAYCVCTSYTSTNNFLMHGIQSEWFPSYPMGYTDGDSREYRDFYNTSTWTSVNVYKATIDPSQAYIYDALGGARRSYLLKDDFYREWDGPDGILGVPISDEYPLDDGGIRQDFEKGVLIRSSSRVGGNGTVDKIGWFCAGIGDEEDTTIDHHDRMHTYAFIVNRKVKLCMNRKVKLCIKS